SRAHAPLARVRRCALRGASRRVPRVPREPRSLLASARLLLYRHQGVNASAQAGVAPRRGTPWAEAVVRRERGSGSEARCEREAPRDAATFVFAPGLTGGPPRLRAKDGGAGDRRAELRRDRERFEVVLGRLGVGIVHGHRATLALDEPRAHRVAVIVPRIARLRFLERLIHRLARAPAIDARRAAGAARGCAARGCATLRHRAPSARGVAAARAAVGTPACRRSAALRAAGAGFPSGRGASRSASRSAARRYATGRWRDAARAVRAARAARATVARRPAARAGRASARSHWAPTARAAGGSPRERGSAARAHVREKIGALGAAARRRENDAERD